MSDLTLFDAPHPRWRRTDPLTSIAAARSITPGRTERKIEAIYAGGAELTDDELAAALPDLYPPTVKTARSRLTKGGRLVDTARRRPSSRGRDQIVWSRPWSASSS